MREVFVYIYIELCHLFAILKHKVLFGAPTMALDGIFGAHFSTFRLICWHVMIGRNDGSLRNLRVRWSWKRTRLKLLLMLSLIISQIVSIEAEYLIQVRLGCNRTSIIVLLKANHVLDYKEADQLPHPRWELPATILSLLKLPHCSVQFE